MTVEEIREKALAQLNRSSNAPRPPELIVKLRDGTSFKGALIERAQRPDGSGMLERLGFSIGTSEVRYCPIESIESL